MLYCDKCGVKVAGNPDSCPLCGGGLSGLAESSAVYPQIRPKKRRSLFAVRAGLLLTVTAAVVCVIVDYSANKRLGWSSYILGIGTAFWIAFALAARHRGSTAKCIFFSVFSVVPVSLLWDLIIGYRGWSLDFVLPICCFAAAPSIIIAARSMKLAIEQYIYYLILSILCGFVPIIFLLTGVTRFAPLSLACIGLSIVLTAALIIFEGRALKEEIIRRTHL